MATVNKEKSASRLAALQKCAAARQIKAAAETRSAKRLEALKKCAAADRSAARREALMKVAGFAVQPVSVAAGTAGGAVRTGLLGALIGGAGGAVTGIAAANEDEAKGKRARTALRHILLGALGGGLTGGAVGGVAGNMNARATNRQIAEFNKNIPSWAR